MVIPAPCESAVSQYRVGLLRFARGRVLVVHGGVFGCSSRMNGKPSSPVLRGLGASNGARLLDPNRVTCGVARLLRETRFIENGFVARVRAVGVVYWSAFTSITACL